MIDREVTSAPVRFWGRLSWRAIIAGAVAAAAIHTMLVLVGMGIGLISADALHEMQGVSIAMGIWWLLSGTVAIFAGAWLAGRFTATHERLDGALAGVVTWSLLTVVSAWLATAATGSLVGGAFTLTSRAAETLASTQNFDVERAAQNFTTGDRGADAARAGNGAPAREQVAARIDTPEAREAAARAADTMGQAALWTAFMLLLGLVAGAVGGLVGNTNGHLVHERYARTTPVRTDVPESVRTHPRGA